MSGFAWTCPFCSRPTTIVGENHQINDITLEKGNAINKELLFRNKFIVCPNPDCNQITYNVTMYNSKWNGNYSKKIPDEHLKTWALLPSSVAMVFPAYIPQPLLEDYNEACIIKDLSPKASATLSRRCLQGMIRNFWGVKGKNLYDEIDAIKEKVDSLTWGAIDAVRKIGNIGAHMEKDINVIVDVEPNEAQLLIGLIETLMKEWYIASYDREQRMKALVSLAEEKDAIKKGE